MKVTATALLLVVLGGATASGGGGSAPLLALEDHGLDRPSRLVALDPRTLEVRARGPSLPGWAFGLEYARSPDRTRIAIFPRPSDSATRLFTVEASGRRIVARIDLGRPACSAAWPAPRRIVLVVGEPPCYSGDTPLAEVVVDPVERRVVARRPISGAALIHAERATENGLALLLGPHSGKGALRLALVGTESVRTIPLAVVRAGRPRALAVDRRGRRAFVAEPGWVVTEVDLVSGARRRHALEPSRRLSTVEKGAVGAVVEAAWAGKGVLGLAGGVARRDGSFVPAGARLVDTRTWRWRRLDSSAGSIAAGDGSIITFQGSRDESSNPARGTGISVYTRAGRLRYRALRAKRVRHVRIGAGYAYVDGTDVGAALDLRAGRQTADSYANLVWSLLVGDRGS